MSDTGAETRSATALDIKLGRRVRLRRLEIGMSQERLAELLGVTFQQVQKYEKGVNRIAASRLVDIANALKLAPAQFFEELRPPVSSSADADAYERALATPEGRELFTLFASFKSKAVRRRTLELVRAIAESK